MNPLLQHLMTDGLRELPGFRLYAICAVLLIIKMHGVGIYTATVRGRHKVTLNPEDSRSGGAQLTPTEHPEVERVLRAHRNDLENIPGFLVLGLVAVLTGAPLTALQICLVAFTLGRFVHSVVYVRGLQPWRSLAYGIGLLSSLVMMVLVLIRVFG